MRRAYLNLRFYFNLAAVLAAICLITNQPVTNAQSLILSVEDSLWTRQDLPGAYMSLETPSALHIAKNYVPALGIKKGISYSKMLIAVNIVTAFEEYDDTAKVNAEEILGKISGSLKEKDPDLFSITLNDTIFNGGISGRRIQGRCALSGEEFPSGNYFLSIYFTDHKLWTIIVFSIDNEVNRQVFQRISNSVKINPDQEQMESASSALTDEKDEEVEEKEEPQKIEYIWKTRNLEGTGVTAELPFDPIKNIEINPAQGIDTIKTYSYINNKSDYLEFSAIYGLLNIDKYVDVMTKARQIISAMKQNVSAKSEIRDFVFKMEERQVSGKNYVKVTGGFALRDYKVNFIYHIYKDGFNIWNINCFYDADSLNTAQIAERIINSVKIDFSAQEKKIERPAVKLQWEERKLDDAGITLEVPFTLTKTIGNIPAQQIDSIISYAYISSDAEFEAAYCKYNSDPFLDAQRRALLVINDLRQILSANRDLQNFVYKVDTVENRGADKAIARGSYIIDGLNVKFIYLIQSSTLKMWDIHFIYLSDSKELCEAAERIINSVKIEDN